MQSSAPGLWHGAQVLAARDGALTLQMGMLKVTASVDEVRRKR